MEASSTYFSDRARAWLERYPATESLSVRVADCVVRIRSNSSALIGHLSRYYRLFLGQGPVDLDVYALQAPSPEIDVELTANPPGPGKTRVKDEYRDFPEGRLLRKRLTGMVFLFGPEHGIAVGPCIENANQVVNFINNRFVQLQVDRGWMLCHAAGVAAQDVGIALAGIAGRGKSTLALHLLDRGLDYVSNDRLLVRRSGAPARMMGLPKWPRVNPGTLLNNPRLAHLLSPDERAQFARLSPEALWELEHKYDVDVEEAFGRSCCRLTANLTGVVVLTWSRGGGATRVESVELDRRRDLLRALMKPVGVHYRATPGSPGPDESEEAYLEHVRGLPAIEIAGGVDFGAAAQACRRLLGQNATA